MHPDPDPDAAPLRPVAAVRNGRRARTVAVALIILAAVAAAVALAGLLPAPASAAPVDPSARGPVARPDTTPRILILGTPHLSRHEPRVGEQEMARVVAALEAYRPDMVVVEYLPPEWEPGRGRDYRPDFDYEAYARAWEAEAGGALVAGTAAGPGAGSGAGSGDPNPCREARRAFLERDLMNATYRWLDADCEAEADSAISAFVEDYAEHEAARVAFPVARAAGVERIVSFDYQGDDTRWFIGDAIREAREEGDERARVRADALMAEVEAFRAWGDTAVGGDYASILRTMNSREWMERQERLYEEVMPRFDFRHAGRHQTIHYWIRNEEMFDRIDEAVAERRPERILVVVGAGHKYFLDEIARERGYRWVDPLDYLPEGSR